MCLAVKRKCWQQEGEIGHLLFPSTLEALLFAKLPTPHERILFLLVLICFSGKANMIFLSTSLPPAKAHAVCLGTWSHFYNPLTYAPELKVGLLELRLEWLRNRVVTS